VKPALTTRGLGPADMDDIAGLIDTILASTRPATGPGGRASRARYSLDGAVVSKVAAQAYAPAAAA
jgi:glycine hydroxymethyltransferase